MAMNSCNSISDWPEIEKKLQRETKAALIQTLRELTTIFPEIHYFVQARYLHTQDMLARIKPYQRQIDAQFVGDMPLLNLPQVQRVIENYQLATGNEERGTVELWVFALEAGAGFIRGMGMHDLAYHSDLTDIAWACVHFLESCPYLYPLYKKRLQTVCGWLNESGSEWITEPLYQLEADMNVLSENT
jgi:hypothetical protein